MDRLEDDLRKALSEEAAFDAQKAEMLKKEAMEMFDAKLRKVERITWAYLIGCVALGVFALFRLLNSTDATDPKELMLCGVLILVAIVTQTLIKLWYWIMNNKISVLKEIKQLRLEMRALSAGGPRQPENESDESATEPRGPVGGLSTRERRVWMVLAVLIGGGIGFTMTLLAAVRPAPTMTSERYLTFADDGSATVLTKMSFQRGIMAMTEFSFHSDGPLSGTRCVDERGMELPVRIDRKDTGYQFVATLAEPIMPGERPSFKMSWEAANLARKEGDVWVYESTQNWGFPSNLYSDVVLLPAPAEIVEVTPEPDSRFTMRDRQGLSFKGRRGANARFRYTIKYRLPASSRARPDRYPP